MKADDDNRHNDQEQCCKSERRSLKMHENIANRLMAANCLLTLPFRSIAIAMADVEAASFQENIRRESFRHAARPGEDFSFPRKALQTFRCFMIIFDRSLGQNILAIVAAQVFGLFPYRKMFSSNIEEMIFKWKSARGLYSSVLVFHTVAVPVLITYKHVLSGYFNPAGFNKTVYYAVAAIYCVLCHQIDWKAFMIRFERAECRFFNDNYSHQPSTCTLRQKMKICTFIGLAASLLNQVLFFMATGHKVWYVASECHWANHDAVQAFIVEHLDHFFAWIPYNHLIGVIAELGNVTTTFYWSFCDVFIMLVSIGVASRFEQINKRIDYFKGRIISIDRWRELRLDYVEVCELLKFADGVLNKLILIASLSNSYLILV